MPGRSHARVGSTGMPLRQLRRRSSSAYFADPCLPYQRWLDLRTDARFWPRPRALRAGLMPRHVETGKGERMQAAKLTIVAAFAILLCAAFAPRAQATAITYNIFATGAAEVNAGGTPNQGDLDGTATGTLTLNDNGTSVGTT